MNRETEFRGKQKVIGDWIYGNLIKFPNGEMGIIPIYSYNRTCDGRNWDFHYTEVIPSTVSQYTGKSDRNGVKLYGGDRVMITEDKSQTYANSPNAVGLMYGDITEVGWNDTNMRWSLFPANDEEEQDMDYYCSWGGWNWLKIAVTIHDTEEQPNAR